MEKVAGRRSRAPPWQTRYCVTSLHVRKRRAARPEVPTSGRGDTEDLEAVQNVSEGAGARAGQRLRMGMRWGSARAPRARVRRALTDGAALVCGRNSGDDADVARAAMMQQQVLEVPSGGTGRPSTLSDREPRGQRGSLLGLVQRKSNGGPRSTTPDVVYQRRVRKRPTHRA